MSAPAGCAAFRLVSPFPRDLGAASFKCDLCKAISCGLASWCPVPEFPTRPTSHPGFHEPVPPTDDPTATSWQWTGAANDPPRCRTNIVDTLVTTDRQHVSPNSCRHKPCIVVAPPPAVARRIALATCVPNITQLPLAAPGLRSKHMM